jgi:hypothetical protein
MSALVHLKHQQHVANGDGMTKQMIDEMNESGVVVPEPGSANHAEIPSPEHVGAELGTNNNGKQCIELPLSANHAAVPATAPLSTTSGTVPEVNDSSQVPSPNTDVADALDKLNESDKEVLAAKLSDAELILRMEKYVFAPMRHALKPLSDVSKSIKGIITEHHALILEAKRRFHAQGRRVPAVLPDGTKEPTYTEWIRTNFTCSDRYVRKVLKQLSASLALVVPLPEKKKGKSKKRQREEWIMSLALEQARATFDNPARARELAKAVLDELNHDGCGTPDTNTEADASGRLAERASVTSYIALPAMVQSASAPDARSEVAAVPAIELPKSIIELDLSIAPVPVPEQVCWRDVLTHLMDKMEQYGDRLPVAVTTEMRGIRKLLEGRTAEHNEPSASAERPTRGYRVKKWTNAGDPQTYFAVIREGDKEPYELYITLSEAESVCDSLNTLPVASLNDDAA